MEWLLAFFNTEVVTAFSTPVTVVEVIGFVTGALCVYAVARQSIWNWGVGLVNNAAFGVLFLGVGLYAEVALQVVFAALAVYGWVNWARGGQVTGELPVRRATRAETILLGAAAVTGTAGVAALLAVGTDSQVPFWDSLVLALSLVATYGQAKKIVSSWWIWIAVDVISVPLYVSRGLLLTALLYVGFLSLCVLGLVSWRRTMRDAGAPAGGPPAEQPAMAAA